MKMKQLLMSLCCLLFMGTQILNACVLSTTYCPPNTYDPNTALDWTTTTFQYYSNNSPASNPKTITSPFYAGPGSVNQNIANFAIPSTKDFLESDGWKYIKHDFGSPSNSIDHPWFILYNRGNGILRVFLAVDNLPDQNGEAMLTLEWLDNNQTALLDHYTGENYSHAVDDFQNNSKVKLANYFANSRPYWLHADFSMAYDPCSCDTPGKLLFKAALIENTNLSFTINGSLIQELDDHGRTSQSGGLDLKSAKKGLSGAIKDGKSGLKTLKDNNVFKNLNGSSPKIADVFNLFGGVGSIVSGAVKLISLFTGSSSSQPANVTPIVFRADLEGNGLLTTESPYEDVIIANPGGDNATIEAAFVPHDDNIMGVFNLLTAPKITVKQYKQQVWGAQLQFTKFFLDSPLEYVLNPRVAVNVSNTDNRILVAYDYETVQANGQNRTMNTTDAYDISCFQDYNPAIQGVISSPPAMMIDLNSIRIKVIARFRTYAGREVVYVARFKADISTQSQSHNGGLLQDDLPAEGCTGFYGPVNKTRVSEVCNSSRYTSRTNFQEVGDTRNDEEAQPLEEIAKEIEKQALKVYPNPSSDGIFTARYTMAEAGRIKISVMDLQGRLLKTVLDEQGHQEGTYETGFELIDFTPGTYLLVQETDQGVISERIMKQ